MADNETPAPTPGTIADTPLLSEIAVGSALVTGAVFVAPSNVSLPTDATTDLTSDYKMLSFTSDKGVVVSESSSKKEIRVWEALALGRTINYNRVEQVKFTPMNLNARVAKVTWGDSAVTVNDTTGAIAMNHHGNPVPPVNLVIESVPFAGAVQRLCGTVQLTERGEVTLNGQDGQGRELTFDCLADSNGDTLHEYLAYTAGATGATGATGASGASS